MLLVYWGPDYMDPHTNADSFARNTDNSDTPKSKLAHPMPVALTFFAGQGEEPVLIKVGTAYESATHHRSAPPAFGPVSGRR